METQKQRKTRNKRIAYAQGIYTRSFRFPKDWGRAMRRHPPTTCSTCGLDLIWYIPLGHYVPTGDDMFLKCTGLHHIPANGKRPHRFA